MFGLLIFGLIFVGVVAECPNSCSGQGDCGSFDQCSCHRNWQGTDCSQRTCPFGMAHVDTPKGDLDASADKLSGPKITVIEGSTVYPYGTQEQFPNMTDSAGNDLPNSAHYYMECSNKGICDRLGGECACFVGYDGSACQRASCPSDCSGHGTCEHIRTLAALNGGIVYNLWDADMTMGCACDYGYSGPDCSERMCKFGVDPLYVDDDATARVEAVTYRLDVNTTISQIDQEYFLAGSYAIIFYDVFGEDYVTEPISVDASCSDIQDSLENLPNKVIPKKSIICTSSPTYAANYSHGLLTSVEYSLKFKGNPGYLKQLEINMYLDGARPTVFAQLIDISDKLDIHVAQFGASVSIWNSGITGEFTDYFANQCRKVVAQIIFEDDGTGILKQTTPGVYDFPELNSGFYLSVDTAETKILKQCFGDSNGDPDDNVEVYDWDYGSIKSIAGSKRSMMSLNPHAIKIVEVGADDLAGGLYYLSWWEPTSKKFILANFPSSLTEGKNFAVYSTNGVVERVVIDRSSSKSILLSDDDTGNEKNIESDDDRTAPRITAFFSHATGTLFTSFDTSCESTTAEVDPCLNPGDMLFLIDSNYLTSSFDPSLNHSTSPSVYGSTTSFESGNLYTIKNIWTNDPSSTTWQQEDRFRITLDKNMPFSGTTVTNEYSNDLWNTTHPIPDNVGIVNLFKFSPGKTGNYDYVSQCSNRGVCEAGMCKCFKGYTDDNCHIQNSLST